LINWMRDELPERFRSVSRGQDLVSVPLKQHFPAFENTETIIRAEDQRLMIHGPPPNSSGQRTRRAIRCAESCFLGSGGSHRTSRCCRENHLIVVKGSCPSTGKG